MTDHHCDAVNTHFAKVPMVAGDRILLHRGRVHEIPGYRFFAAGMTLDAYGDGDHPPIINCIGSNNDAWLYVRGSGVRLRNFSVDGNGFKGTLISVSTDQAIEDIAIEDIAALRCDGIGVYLNARGDRGRIRRARVERVNVEVVGYHGMHCTGDVSEVDFIEDKVKRAGCSKPGHGFSAWAAKPGERVPRWITYTRCEASETFDVDGVEGQGFQSDDNTFSIRYIECSSHRNKGAGFAFNNSHAHTLARCRSEYNQKPGLIASNGASGSIVVCNRFEGNSLNGKYRAEVQAGANIVANNWLYNRSNLPVGIIVADQRCLSDVQTFGYGTPVEVE